MRLSCPGREKAMEYSIIVRNGEARDEALKRRNSQMRVALGMKATPKREAEKPDAPKVDERPRE
jgi:hypothetical protein